MHLVGKSEVEPGKAAIKMSSLNVLMFLPILLLFLFPNIQISNLLIISNKLC